jgi:A/G-specific adenine glycosylase
LAAANEGEVLRLWQGLGYYSRGRNLHKTAKVVVDEFGGRFPDNFRDLQKLKGVGKYTAAAIASFAFNESVPAIDGNALRVIARFFEIFDPIDSPTVQKNIFEISSVLMQNVHAGNYNQAVMELGAIVCTPKKPSCNACPINIECKAFKHKSVGNIPIKAKKTKVSNKFLQYFVFEYNSHLWLKKRAENEIWANMYDFYLVESENLEYFENIEKCLQEFKIDAEEIINYPTISNLLTHQRQQIVFVKIRCKSNPIIDNGNWYNSAELDELAKPKIIVDFLERLKKD